MVLMMLEIEHIQKVVTHLDEQEQNRILKVINAYIMNKGVKFYSEIVPDDIVLAGVELAKAFIAGELYAGRKEGVVTSKSSKAGDVSVSKTYADGVDGQAMSQSQMIADALLQPYILKSSLGMSVVRV